MSEVFIGRQPILDRDMNVFAYELRFHQGLNPNKESLQATSELIKSTEDNIGFQAIVGHNNMMLHLPKDLLDVNNLPNLDPDTTLVLEIPNNVSKDVEVLKKLRDIRQAGSKIALDDFVDDDSSIKLAGISDYVKVDVEAHTEIQLKLIIESLHHKGVQVIAEKVETEEMFNYLKKLGFDYFQGYFFTNPIIINGQKLSGNNLTLLQLLAKVNDPATDFYELSQIVGQDVALSHKLLVAINNPTNMIPIRVETISDALKYMGLKRLKFWVNMLMLSNIENVPKELMITSLMRAKFCEIIAETSGQKTEKDSYFLVGLFSNLGAFFKVPIEDVVSEMPLADNLQQALVERVGPMGDAIRVLGAMEQASSVLGNLKYDGLGINEIGNSFMVASAWAHQAITQ